VQDNNISIAVVGVGGFIGSSVAKYLKSAQVEVSSFTSKQPLVIDNQIHKNLQDASTVIWCASRVNPLTAETSPNLAELELSEWRTFLDIWQEQANPTQAIIFLSSGGCTYSSNSLPFAESSEANGTNKYGKLKLAMEKELILRQSRHLILRVANVYGPGQMHGRGQGVIAEWVNSMNNNEDLKVFGSLTSFRDYLFIEDLCEAIFHSLKLDNYNEIFNLGCGQPISLQTILDICISYKLEKVKIHLEQERVIDRTGYYLDINKFTSLTNWKPVHSIEAGLLRTLKSHNE
jgi:UDP-glucose 4-epimerase